MEELHAKVKRIVASVSDPDLVAELTVDLVMAYAKETARATDRARKKLSRTVQDRPGQGSYSSSGSLSDPDPDLTRVEAGTASGDDPNANERYLPLLESLANATMDACESDETDASAPASARYGEAFLAFWATYPRKVGKGAAWNAWRRQKPRLAEVHNALSWQVRQPEWRKDGGAFVPHPATWLNQRRWEDEAPRPVVPLRPRPPPVFGETPEEKARIAASWSERKEPPDA